MIAECGWDGGDCSERFEVAGPDAALSCKREQNGDGRDVCGPGLFSELALSECAQECVVASCDWSLTNVYCQRALNQLVDCPLFDAAVYQSLVNQSGLVFVKEGGTARGLGRCKNASCSSAHPPPMPAWCTEPACQVNNTSETEWCETVDDGGRVLEMGCEVVCTITVDIGQSWGLCSRNRPRLPVSGFNFDADKLRRVAEISIDAVFREVSNNMFCTVSARCYVLCCNRTVLQVCFIEIVQHVLHCCTSFRHDVRAPSHRHCHSIQDVEQFHLKSGASLPYPSPPASPGSSNCIPVHTLISSLALFPPFLVPFFPCLQLSVAPMVIVAAGGTSPTVMPWGWVGRLCGQVKPCGAKRRGPVQE